MNIKTNTVAASWMLFIALPNVSLSIFVGNVSVQQRKPSAVSYPMNVSAGGPFTAHSGYYENPESTMSVHRSAFSRLQNLKFPFDAC